MIYTPLCNKQVILKKKGLMRVIWIQRGLERLHLRLRI